MLASPSWICRELLVAAFVACSAACASEPVAGSTSTSAASGAGGALPDAGMPASAGASVGTGGSELPPIFTVSGIVTDGVAPVEGAIVMQAGGAPAFTTGADGAYTLELTNAVAGTPTVVAAKLGYRSAGVEFAELPDGEVELALGFVTPPDNPSYTFGDPGKGTTAADNSTKFCGHCHTTLVAQFQTSAHAKATKDPLVQDLYAGVAVAIDTEAKCTAAGGVFRSGLVPGTTSTAATKCYLGGGVLPDLNPACGAPGTLACDDPALDAGLKPSAFGSCADCHAPGIDGPAGGRNLHDAVGVAFDNGNHCDVCHHARDFDLTKPPGAGGALVLQRPRDKQSEEPTAKLVQVMFGPLPDVPNGFMGGSYQPKFATSEVCGACHEQKQQALLPGTTLNAARWPDGLPTHSTHSEWSASPFNTPGTQCQFCHMPPDDSGLESSVDVTDATNASIAFGFLRAPGVIKKHIFRGPLVGSPRLIDGAVALGVAASPNGGALDVTVKLENTAAGHAIPTGEPMRSLVLLVHAEACGATMVPFGGMTVDDWGGALAEGIVGADVVATGVELTWPAGAAAAKAGDVVRVVRPTGQYDDYSGIGFFADPLLTPAQKGIEVRAPVGEATVVLAGAGKVTSSKALTVQNGDRVYLGEALAWPPADAATSLAIAGSAGYSFARTLLDPLGRAGVPHYRAVDIRSDNRLAPQVKATTTHAFALPPSCSSATVTATLLYRPLSPRLARERRWDAKDYVIATATQNVALP